MSDFIDEATNATETALAERLAKVSSRASKAQELSAHFRETGQTRPCDDCGATIPNRRLIAVPFATRCASCQEAIEREAQTRR